MAALAMDVEGNDLDDGWGDELAYQPHGPFYTQQAWEAHRMRHLDVGVVTSSVGLAAWPPAGQGRIERYLFHWCLLDRSWGVAFFLRSILRRATCRRYHVKVGTLS